MKRFLVILSVITIICLAAKSQTFYTTVNDNSTRLRQEINLTAHIPIGSTPTLNNGKTRAGALFYRTTDSSLYTWTGYEWIKLPSMVDIISPTTVWLRSGNTGTNPPTEFLGTTDLKPLVFKTNGSNRMQVAEAGNVGIGTPTPIYKLDVNGTGRFSDTVIITTMGLLDSSNNAASTAFVKRIAMGGGSTPTWQSTLLTIGGSTMTGNNSIDGDGTDFVWNNFDSLYTVSNLFRYDGLLKYVDGNQGNGKILTSNAAGVATWQNSSQLISDTIYILVTGQSNSNGRNKGNIDTAANPMVQAWNGNTNTWATMRRQEVPMGMSLPWQKYSAAGDLALYDTSTNAGFYLAKRLQEKTGKFIRVFVIGYGANPVENFVPEGSSNFTTIKNNLVAAGSPHVDILIWHQGESNIATVDSVYKNRFDSLISQFKRQPWFGAETPIFVVGVANLFIDQSHIVNVHIALTSGLYGKDYTYIDATKDSTMVGIDGVSGLYHFSALGQYQIANKIMKKLYGEFPQKNSFIKTSSAQRTQMISDIPNIGKGLISQDSTTGDFYEFNGTLWSKFAPTDAFTLPVPMLLEKTIASDGDFLTLSNTDASYHFNSLAWKSGYTGLGNSSDYLGTIGMTPAGSGASMKFSVSDGSGSGFDIVTMQHDGFYIPLKTFINTTSGSEALNVSGNINATGSISLGTDKFQVNNTGNPIKINNIATSFPSVQGLANTHLQNDGSGNLSWARTIYVADKGDFVNQTATHTHVSYTTPNDGNLSVYDIGCKLKVTVVTGGILTTTITYTDETNNAVTITLYGMGLTSPGVSVLGPTNFPVAGEIVCYPNTIITVTTTLTVGTATYDANSTILYKRSIPL